MELSGIEPLTKDKKPFVEKYHYFKTRVKIAGKTYDIIFDTEQMRGERQKKPQTAHLYNVKEVKNPPSASRTKAAIKRTEGGLESTLTQDMSIVNRINGKRFMPKGIYNRNSHAIRLLSTADYSTLPHELSHFWLDNMWEYVRGGQASKANEDKRQEVECWTRSMGYYRPVCHFNVGKKAEFNERKWFIFPENGTRPNPEQS